MRIAYIAFVVLLMVLGGCKQETEDLSQTQFPENLRHQVQLAKDRDGKGGVIRYLAFNEDKTRLIAAEVEFPDGTTEFQQYRLDGTLREVEGFYPLAEGEKNRKPRRTLLYDKDGKTVLFDRINRVDGTIEKIVRSRVGGGLESEIFYEDGRSVKVRKTTGTRGETLFEDQFRADGSLERHIRKIGYDEREITEYRTNGTRSSVTVRGTGRWSESKTWIYGYDGVMVEMKVRYAYYATEVEYYRDNGVLAERRNYTQYGVYTATVYGPDGKARYQQRWTGTVAEDRTDVSNYKLKSVEEYKADGSSVAREIEFHEDGKTVKKIRTPDGLNYYSGTFRYFRPDGTLEKEEVKTGYDKVQSTREFTPEENVRETIPQEYLNRGYQKNPPAMPEEVR